MTTITSLYAARTQAKEQRKATGCVVHINVVIHEVRDEETREVIGHKVGGYWLSDWCDASTVESI